MQYSPNIIIGGDEVPVGELLELIGLPPCDTVRWTARRKAEIVAAVQRQQVTAEDACNWYGLSAEEFDEWCRATERGGVAGLRVTCSQQARRQAARQIAHADS